MTKRDINYEFLRIISMLMVLILHYFFHGQVLNNVSDLPIYNKILVIIFETLSIVAVNIYILISSYHLCEKKFNIKRIISLITTVWLFNLLVGGSMLLFGITDFNIKNIFRLVFPILSQEYWFINAYIFLIIISPFINKFIGNLSKKEFKNILIILLFINSIIPVITKNSVAMNSANSLSWFVNLYLIGSYLKKHPLNINKKNNILIYIISNLVICILVLIIIYIKNIDFAMNFYKYNNILILLSSVCLFNIFSTIKQFKLDFINKSILNISRYCILVYIITENIFFRDYLWLNILNTSFMNTKWYYIFIVLGEVLLIFIICILIGSLIEKIIYKPKMFVNKHIETEVTNKCLLFHF